MVMNDGRKSNRLVLNYRQTSNIRRILASNKIVDHLDVAGATPAGAAPSSLPTKHLASMHFNATREEKKINFVI